VLLDDQDRSTWHLDEIKAANLLLKAAMDLRQPGPFQIDAVIGSYHANARTAEDTDWTRIAGLYDHLLTARGAARPRAVDGLEEYHLFHAARGEFLARSGRTSDAIEAFRRAAKWTSNPAERRHLARRIAHHLEHGVE
jgi:RNA polymerase sigma-70 factor (ECF subfamily)